MSITTIEWTDRTWNPTRGCSRVSPGCVNCYAERIASRFSAGPGDGAKRQGEFNGFVQIANGHQQWTGKVELIESKLTEPLHWRKPCRVFVNSMSDLFHEALPDRSINRIFAVMAQCERHTFQIVTKRADRMLDYMRCHSHNPFPNVWLGVSVENQATADERIPLLLQTPAAVRFVSYEPALGPVDFKKYGFDFPDSWLAVLDWLIVGGESGPGARPFDIAWARSARDQCRAAGVAFFMKQFGADPRERNANGNCRDFNCTHPDCAYVNLKLKDRKGGDMSEWPKDLRIREFPNTGSTPPSKLSTIGGRPDISPGLTR